jgi:hypothetical protein
VTTANVVGIHGISQQQAGRLQLLPVWQLALADGVERAVGRDGPRLELDLAYYADVYLKQFGTKGVGGIDPADLDHDMVKFFDQIETEVVDEEPPKDVQKGLGGLPHPVGRLAAWLDSRFGAAGALLFFGDLIQVRRYQRDDDLGDEIRSRVQEAIDSQTRVLVAHSLGSVVAYEYLCLEPEHGVETLVTLGSPLGLRSIQARLRTARDDGRPAPPRGVERWVNIRDPSDPVACAGGLSATWPAVADELVDNGGDPHAVTRYLGKRQTGAAVVASLAE